MRVINFLKIYFTAAFLLSLIITGFYRHIFCLEERAVHYKTLQQILCEDAGSAFIQVPPLTIAMNKQLAGYTFYPIYVQDMSTVYWVK